MGQLSSTSGIPVATIKFYLREGLLHPGQSTSANQAVYDETHVRRIRLIRALTEVGQLPVASARAVLAAVDDEKMPLGHVFGAAQYAISSADLYRTVPSPASSDRVDALIARRGWRISSDCPARAGAANVIDSFEAIEHPELVELIDDYAIAAEQVARADLSAVGRQADLSAMAETVVAGTILGDAMFAALRRLAQEHVSVELYGLDTATDPFGRLVETVDNEGEIS